MKQLADDRKLAAIVMADVVGYSRLMGVDESGTLATMRRHRRDFIDPLVAAHHGRVVNAPGDSILLEFGSAVGAVRCAIAMQQGMSTRTLAEDPARRIMFRIGVNIGDIIVDRGEIFGDGVNVAARLEGLAEAGGICISRAAYEQIRTAIEIAFIDQGAHAVKNIARPVEVYALPASVIAGLPSISPPAEARASSSWRRPAAVAVGLAGIALGAAAAFILVRPNQKPLELEKALDAPLAIVLPDVSEKSRAKLIANYTATAEHRAFAVAPRTGGRWYSGDWPSRADAEDKSLERCQAAFGEPCALIAVDAEVYERPSPVRDMPKTRYAGSFDPFWIPGVRGSVRQKSEVVGYAAATGPKAVAYNLRGLVFVVTGAASQVDAETQALKDCNAEPARKDVEGACFLYAVENHVVLPERRTKPLSVP